MNMKIKKHIILPFILTGYLATVLFTGLSLTGFWTDIIFSFILAIITLKTVFSKKKEKLYISIFTKTITILSSVIIFSFIVINLINPFSWVVFRTETLIYKQVDNRLFNAYFTPIGAYGGPEFWITESPVYFPFIEIQKYRNSKFRWYFNLEKDEVIDKDKVIKNYVRDEIINKDK